MRSILDIVSAAMYRTKPNQEIMFPGWKTQELIEQAKRGDHVAFESIYRQHKERVFRLCMRFTNSVSDSEDLTQEVFLNVYRKLHGFRGEAAFSTWLYRVAINTTMMFLRVRRKDSSMVPLISTSESDVAGKTVLRSSRHGYTAFTLLALKQAVAALPQGRRRVLILHDIHGMSHTEVGGRLGIAPITSKSQLHYARVALRGVLKGKEHRTLKVRNALGKAS
jgi:RNA polymerase sigma factor (sigma-70 family)